MRDIYWTFINLNSSSFLSDQNSKQLTAFNFTVHEETTAVPGPGVLFASVTLILMKSFAAAFFKAQYVCNGSTFQNHSTFLATEVTL